MTGNRLFHSQPPNILLICSDQHAWRYQGHAGHRIVLTPNLDAMAHQGVSFNHAYCSSPLCAPSRASFITGMYPSDVDSYCNATPWRGQATTWASRLKQAGYDCFATGKMDLDDQHDTGFEEVNTRHSHCRRPDITSLFRNPMCHRFHLRQQVDGKWRGEPSHDREHAQRVIDFLGSDRARASRPWAWWVGLSMPHPPFVALTKYQECYPLKDIDQPQVSAVDLEVLHPVYQQMRHFKGIATPIDQERITRARAAYYGMITELDEYVGNIHKALIDSGLIDNTLLVYTSDHGESLGEHGLWFKGNLFEHNVRVPLIMTGAGIARGRKVEVPVSQVDLVATLLDHSGLPASVGARGASLTGFLRGEATVHRGWVYAESHGEGNVTGSFMLRKGSWKYIHFTGYPSLLFNLREDPHEKINRLDDPSCRDILDELKTLLNHYIDTDAVTWQAFAAQDHKLRQICQGQSEMQIRQLLQGRLGEGQATILARKVHEATTFSALATTLRASLEQR